MPTFEASIPEIVGNEHYVKALSLSRIAVDMEAIAGPIVAGLLVAWLGVRWVFWFDAGTYLISALLVMSVVIPHVAQYALAPSPAKLRSQVTHGSCILLREPSLRQSLVLSFAEATAVVATVAYVEDVLGRGATTYALLMAGLVLGSSLAARALGRLTGRYEQGNCDRATLHGVHHR